MQRQKVLGKRNAVGSGHVIGSDSLQRGTEMDYKKLIEECSTKADLYLLQGAAWLSTHENQCALAITDLLSRAEAAEAAQETLQRAMAEYKALSLIHI